MIITGQGTATASASRLGPPLPPGPCTMLISNNGTASTVWIGAGTTATTGTGFPVPSGQVPTAIPGYLGSGGAQLWVVTSGGTATVGYLISTATAGTGL